MNRFTQVMLAGAGTSAFLYCFVVIFLPDYFTYNGTTGIFMSVNYIFSSLLVLMKSSSPTAEGVQNEKYVKLDILVDTFVEQAAFREDGQDDQVKLSKVLESTKLKNVSYLKHLKLVMLVAYLCSFVAYFIIIITKNPKDKKLVGLTNVVLLLTSDLM
jgi:hypothetical protein